MQLYLEIILKLYVINYRKLLYSVHVTHDAFVYKQMVKPLSHHKSNKRNRNKNWAIKAVKSVMNVKAAKLCAYDFYMKPRGNFVL